MAEKIIKNKKKTICHKYINFFLFFSFLYVLLSFKSSGPSHKNKSMQKKLDGYGFFFTVKY